MVTILGAGGVIANEVVRLLSARKQPFRLVARNARPVPAATEMIFADLSDKGQTIRAVAGSSIVYLLVGLQYDHKLWAEMWPRIMTNTIEGCKRSGAKLIFFDNVYMYGKVSGVMAEETPFNPCSKKGEVRAKIATSLSFLSALSAILFRNSQLSPSSAVLQRTVSATLRTAVSHHSISIGPASAATTSGFLVTDLSNARRAPWLRVLLREKRASDKSLASLGHNRQGDQADHLPG
jgi:NAD(P)H-binding